jgi:hypothetical protein
MNHPFKKFEKVSKDKELKHIMLEFGFRSLQIRNLKIYPDEYSEAGRDEIISKCFEAELNLKYQLKSRHDIDLDEEFIKFFFRWFPPNMGIFII